MNNSIDTQPVSRAEISCEDLLGSLMKRLVALVGAPAAMQLAQRIPGLTIDSAGNLLSWDCNNVLETVTAVMDEYAFRFGHIDMPLTQQVMRILLVDDHVLVREGLIGLIAPQSDMLVVGEAGSVQEAITVARQVRPDLVLLDISLPDGKGQDAAHAILSEMPSTKIVFLTVHDEDDLLYSALRAGAVGYLLKNVHAADLLAKLRAVARGDVAISPVIARRILEMFAGLPVEQPSAVAAASELTDRELEILRELTRGSSNREIAQRLVISENTVKNHIHNVLQKLNLSRREDAAEFMRTRDREAFVPPPHRSVIDAEMQSARLD